MKVNESLLKPRLSRETAAPDGEKEPDRIPHGNCTIFSSGKLTKRLPAARTASQSGKKPSAARRAISVARLHSEFRSAYAIKSEPQGITTNGWKPERAATYAQV